MSNRQRILYEIEKVLEITEERLKLETVRKKGSGKRRVPNRDIYRILKAVNQCRNTKPQIVYTGGEILKREEAEEMEEEIPQLEPSM